VEPSVKDGQLEIEGVERGILCESVGGTFGWFKNVAPGGKCRRSRVCCSAGKRTKDGTPLWEPGARKMEEMKMLRSLYDAVDGVSGARTKGING
jgi:hypothetical protein